MPVPDWENVIDITRGLREIIDEGDYPEDFRPKLARSIALLRDDKQFEQLEENQQEIQRILFRTGR